MDHTVSARSNSRRRASLALAILPIGLLSTGCQDAVFTEFRAASNDLIQAGARSIALGLVDGFFAVTDPDGSGNGGAADTSTTGGNTTGGSATGSPRR